MFRIGVDFGGTKIEAAALSSDGRALLSRRVPTPGDYDGAIHAVCGLVRDLEQQLGGNGSIGIGTPGSISPRSGLLRNANTTYLNGRAFGDDLAEAFQRPVRLANDANCLALSEAFDGAAVGAHVTCAIILGTGCGGGLVVDGRLVEGANGIGGEWGHIPLPWQRAEEAPGPRCWCGRLGCLETWISGTGLQRDFDAQTGRRLTGEAILLAVREGDPQAEAALHRLVDRLARSMALLINVVDPDVFVFGGGLSSVDLLYERLPDLIARYAFCEKWSGRIARAQWGSTSGVRGAARLWDMPDWSSHHAGA